jgi:hypothetical protein
MPTHVCCSAGTAQARTTIMEQEATGHTVTVIQIHTLHVVSIMLVRCCIHNLNSYNVEMPWTSAWIPLRLKYHKKCLWDVFLPDVDPSQTRPLCGGSRRSAASADVAALDALYVETKRSSKHRTRIRTLHAPLVGSVWFCPDCISSLVLLWLLRRTEAADS